MSDSELIKAINKNVNILVYICLFIITFCCLMSFLNSLTFASMYPDTLTYEAPTMICMNGKCKYIDDKEHFSNDELFSYKKQDVSNYMSATLLSPYDEFRNPTNLFFGKANVYINNNKGDDNIYYRLEIYCNLLVLDGNIYDVAKRGTIDQKYIVYLVNDKTGKKKLIGNLYKDGDGIYKIKAVFKNNIDELVSYNKINIVYSLDNKEQVLLEGFFN